MGDNRYTWEFSTDKSPSVDDISIASWVCLTSDAVEGEPSVDSLEGQLCDAGYRMRVLRRTGLPSTL